MPVKFSIIYFKVDIRLYASRAGGLRPRQSHGFDLGQCTIAPRYALCKREPCGLSFGSIGHESVG